MSAFGSSALSKQEGLMLSLSMSLSSNESCQNLKIIHCYHFILRIYMESILKEQNKWKLKACWQTVEKCSWLEVKCLWCVGSARQRGRIAPELVGWRVECSCVTWHYPTQTDPPTPDTVFTLSHDTRLLLELTVHWVSGCPLNGA